MKFNKIFNISTNKRTNQVSFNIRAREIKKMGLTPTQILNMTIPQNQVKFYKKENKKKK